MCCEDIMGKKDRNEELKNICHMFCICILNLMILNQKFLLLQGRDRYPLYYLAIQKDFLGQSLAVTVAAVGRGR